jgi:hypothetical protein
MVSYVYLLRTGETSQIWHSRTLESVKNKKKSALDLLKNIIKLTGVNESSENVYHDASA